MSLATHRAALVALMRDVPGIGQVHDEEPYARHQNEFRALYVSADDADQAQVRGWFVTRARTLERTLGVGRVMNAHTWQVRGFMALQPPDSGKAFDVLIELVRQRYRIDETLGGQVEPGPIDNPTGFQVNDSRPVMFAGVLCHSATLSITTYELLDAGE